MTKIEEKKCCQKCGVLLSDTLSKQCQECDNNLFWKWFKITILSLFGIALLITVGIEFYSEIVSFLSDVRYALLLLFDWFPSFIQTFLKVIVFMVVLSPIIFILVVGILSAIEDTRYTRI